MRIRKAVITAAARNERTLPLQSLVDRDGVQKAVLGIVVDEARQAGIEEVCVIVRPGDEESSRRAAGDFGGQLHFIPQPEPLGYGHAVYCAREFVGREPFLHMLGDHVYVSESSKSLAQQLVDVAVVHSCAVSGVQSTRENLLPYFGTIGGQRVKGSRDLYSVDRVVEKPTPTEAEQTLIVPGLRAGHYLCFFGMHVLTPTVMDLLEAEVQQNAGAGTTNIQLSPVLNAMAQQERYLAFEARGKRYPLDVRYGLLTAQLALALSGKDRDEVLADLVELLAQRNLGNV